ncbi:MULTISPECIES: LLM class flavin-dependent oxidoreductase [unclassified Novosphingobium]|uniref:LLM class flavin-dependent oxidoreductase n=1 Tax=unclassified Novosphingobium TaxID=2644732 RepID=UPI00190F9CD6|nr:MULTISPECIES: LLM class flavin-dependent oxidoreductase [unclassified Novosphingobium]
MLTATTATTPDVPAPHDFGRMPADLAAHPGYSRVFRPGHLTFGFIMPMEGYPDSPFPTMRDHAAMARRADEAGFAALWMHDVPFYDPSFGDTGQVFDPFVYLGFLAAHTQRITLGTAGIVLPLRDPLIVAKQAASVDVLPVEGWCWGCRAATAPRNILPLAQTMTIATRATARHRRSSAL